MEPKRTPWPLEFGFTPSLILRMRPRLDDSGLGSGSRPERPGPFPSSSAHVFNRDAVPSRTRVHTTHMREQSVALTLKTVTREGKFHPTGRIPPNTRRSPERALLPWKGHLLLHTTTETQQISSKLNYDQPAELHRARPPEHLTAAAYQRVTRMTALPEPSPLAGATSRQRGNRSLSSFT